MKILVISDSHGNVANLKHVLGFAKKYGVSAVVHAGDWNTLESIETVLSFGIPLYTVLGNADVRSEVIQKLKGKSRKFGEEFLSIKIGGRNIGITHKPSNNKKYFSGVKLDVVFNGHLHSKYESVKSVVKIVRPGAIINGNNFAVYDTATNRVEFIEDDQV
ncbi:MAG: metallophosphoesterase family protein [Candidatus Woesebacteria bacterium]|nr:metallophosphoesterase family protein [Candidatus Woesebacteria bacterium]